MPTCKNCSECTFLDLNNEYNSNDGRFRCEAKYEWHYANEIACYRECYAYGRDSSVARAAFKHSEECRSSSGCYLTTITCEIMGLDDDSYYLQTLRNFRKNVLQKNKKYKQLLVEYDIIGPIIARKLKQDNKKDMIALNLLNLGISKTVYHILNNDNLNAIKTYMTMTELLIQGYNIPIKPTELQIKNADINKSGHGVYVKKKCRN